ncbi:hypothetical protein Xedl_03293 [Xenorhabdus eapokensis]|uniref:Uncharacterized protein n=2 Tax=Xenorhabdus eapokensis TaxID=1873482 RepID=A0A1Q5TJZ6_9GAMM|nr:hypothetical protein Xedl_03293 [Xenorhabdus eapokensis]
MSDVNKLDNKQCPFDPDQYKTKVKIDNDIAAPESSFPWAIIKAYLGNKVYRSNWNFPVEYIRLAGIPDNDPYIEKHKPENTTSWNPTQEDLVACDWKVMCPDDSMLSFDLKIGTSCGIGWFQYWGCATEKTTSYSPFGTLTNLQNTLGIRKMTYFGILEDPVGTFSDVALSFDTLGLSDLGNKNLEVIVNGSIYNLGLSFNDTDYIGYQSDGAKLLGDLLKQNVGNTLSFCFNWK